MTTDLIPSPQPRTIDLTGLPESVVQQVLRLVEGARRDPAGEAPAAGFGHFLPLPPDQWRAEFAAWKESAAGRADRYPVGHVLDDSRETIYGDRDRA